MDQIELELAASLAIGKLCDSEIVDEEKTPESLKRLNKLINKLLGILEK